jgi:hypothetical protein
VRRVDQTLAPPTRSARRGISQRDRLRQHDCLNRQCCSVKLRRTHGCPTTFRSSDRNKNKKRLPLGFAARSRPLTTSLPRQRSAGPAERLIRRSEHPPDDATRSVGAGAGGGISTSALVEGIPPPAPSSGEGRQTDSRSGLGSGLCGSGTADAGSSGSQLTGYCVARPWSQGIHALDPPATRPLLISFACRSAHTIPDDDCRDLGERADLVQPRPARPQNTHIPYVLQTRRRWSARRPPRACSSFQRGWCRCGRRAGCPGRRRSRR